MGKLPLQAPREDFCARKNTLARDDFVLCLAAGGNVSSRANCAFPDFASFRHGMADPAEAYTARRSSSP
jgi:hypothetical protein